jgi:thioredoxin-like negative regulator of GroEL
MKHLTDKIVDNIFTDNTARLILFYDLSIPMTNQIIDIFKEFEKKLENNVEVMMCEYNKNPKIKNYFKTNSLPAIIFLKNDKVYGNIAGQLTKLRIESLIKDSLLKLIEEKS